MPVYDLTLAGFDGTTDTDDCVKWIKAPSLNIVQSFASLLNLRPGYIIEEMKGRDDLDIEDGVDVILGCDLSDWS